MNMLVHVKSIKGTDQLSSFSSLTGCALKVPDTVNRTWTPLLHAITSSSKTGDKWCKNLPRAVIMRFEQTEWIVSVGFKPSHEKQLLPVVQGEWRLMGRRVREREREKKKPPTNCKWAAHVFARWATRGFSLDIIRFDWWNPYEGPGYEEGEWGIVADGPLC